MAIPIDDIARIAGVGGLLLMGLAAAAAPARYGDAAGFVRGTARGLEPIPGARPTQSAEAVAGDCLDALAGPEGRDAFVRASLNGQGEFHLTPEQRSRLDACLLRAGYRVRLPDPVPPGAKRYD